ncbi:M48 family metalloprotease [Georgenia muralis]|uniref:Peptidase M48-like protein n=1 Tax=Georgenia muralis TaxID=154117 RepID=A0A3N4Z6U5_9MICO|nr:M48 family metalloprotease [Georgenia muralis]RPF28047.1 peptidase M48-like protein [Georgenia muralis]
MTAAVLAVLLAVLLGVGALAPRLRRRPTPTFSARPRLGLAAWTGAALAWTAGLLVLGPLLAWAVTGPALPGAVGDVCRRCLVATNPFGPATTPATTDVPVFVLLLVPAVLALALVGRAAVDLARAGRAADAHLAALGGTALRADALHGNAPHGTTLHANAPPPEAGDDVVVWLVEDDAPAAYALPGRRGVVLTSGGLDALTAPQLHAVLGHERAHVLQRHHTLLGLLAALARVLGRVPLVAHAHRSAARYAEMAADDAARRAAGTRALAGALLALGGHPDLQQLPAGVPTLHVAGRAVPWRTARLVTPPSPPSRWGLAAVVAYLAAVVTVVALVVVPYGTVLVTGTC